MVRDGDRLRRAGWDEALARAAEGLGETLTTHGGSAIGVFSCSKSTNELNFLVQKLARTALHTNNIDSCNRT
jgi:formate dehydrogenase major subunit